MRKFLKKTKRIGGLVEPDEIFLDSKNLQGFDEQQFEGRLEKPITKKTLMFLGFAFLMVGTLFVGRLGILQVKEGQAYYNRSENNKLERVIVFADRGIIYDRNGKELAWNENINLADDIEGLEIDDTLKTENYSVRSYLSPGFSHVLGYVSRPIQDSSGKYWQAEFIGKDGLEKIYNEYIKGVNGEKLIERDAFGEVASENTISTPERGIDLITTIDSRLQGQLYEYIKQVSTDYKFEGGAGLIMDVTNGEVLAATSYPEYDSTILSRGKDKEKISSYLVDPRNVFMDKTISGLYTPGSIVKPIFAIGALNEGIIDPEKEILSTGSISIPNPYDPTKETIFRDWKAHGWTDMREAIAVSSDVYFYAVGGGYGDQEGLGISRIEKYAKLFGVGDPSGIDLPDESHGNIPNPEWKAKAFNGDIWRLGDTYNTSIGQYGFLVTPFEMLRAVGAIANGGKLMTPHFLMEENGGFKEVEIIDIPNDYFEIVREGMRGTVKYGTATSLNVPYTEAAAKTGTAQVGISKSKINSWVIGFFPYDEPKYAFTIMMEKAPSKTSIGASFVMRQLFDWMKENTPEYFDLNKTE